MSVIFHEIGNNGSPYIKDLTVSDQKVVITYNDGGTKSIIAYEHPTTSGNKHIPSGGKSGQILRWSADGTAVWGEDNDTTYSSFKGATTSVDGDSGLVPAPAIKNTTQYLRGDGTWATPTNTTYETATDSVSGLMSTKDKIKLDTIEDGANKYIHPNSGVTAGTYKSITVNAEGHITNGTNPTTLAGYGITDAATKSHTHKIADITDNIPASKISGVLSLDNIPQGALERVYIAADDVARLALTTDQVQNGDVVKVTSTGKMYFIVDQTKLSTEDGYTIFTAGTASAVAWSNVTDKPSTFTPSDHTQTISTITGLQTALDGKASTSVFGKATADATGSNGLVPAPAKGDQLKFLRADGVWVIPTNTTYSVGTTSYSGTTKLYTETGSSVDGTMTQNAITTALNEKALIKHTHKYASSTTEGGAADSAIKLNTARKIGSALFDGTNDITLTQMGVINPIELTRSEYDALITNNTIDENQYYNVIDDYDSDLIINDNTISSKYVYSSDKVEKTYSKKSISTTAILTAANWSGSSAPYSYTLSVSGVTATNVVEINYSSTASDSAIEAYQKAGLKDGGQATDKITLLAEQKPVVNIPIAIIIRNDL